MTTPAAIPAYTEAAILDKVPSVTPPSDDAVSLNNKCLDTPNQYDDPEKVSEKEDAAAQWVDVVELTPIEALERDVDGDQSPFPEVAACVPNTDDPSIEVNSKPRVFPLWFADEVHPRS